jgi:hypothetical protein
MIMMVMVVVMVMVAMMIVVMVVIVSMMMVLIAIRIGIELFGRHLLVGDPGEFGDVVDHLILVNWRAEFGKHARVVAVEVIELPLLARELPNALQERAVYLLVSDLDLLAAPNLREDETEPHPPGGDISVFCARFFLSRTFVLKAPLVMLKIVRELAPNGVELIFDESRR